MHGCSKRHPTTPVDAGNQSFHHIQAAAWFAHTQPAFTIFIAQLENWRNLLVSRQIWRPGQTLQAGMPVQIGKRSGRQVTTTTTAGQPQPSRLFYLTDRNSHIKFLIDTGAQVSVIPACTAKTSSPANYTLKAANGSAIATFGNRSLCLDIGLRRPFQWIFIIADVSCGILGVDFLTKFNLVVDVGRSRLVDSITGIWTNGLASHCLALVRSYTHRRGISCFLLS